MWIRSSQCDTNTCVEVDMSWYKSTLSGSQGGNCVEVNVNWRKSSISGNNGSCVEFATDSPDGRIAVRDSKDKDGLVLTFSPGAWTAFIESVKRNELTA